VIRLIRCDSLERREVLSQAAPFPAGHMMVGGLPPGPHGRPISKGRRPVGHALICGRNEAVANWAVRKPFASSVSVG
jgi:hypothetical protein